MKVDFLRKAKWYIVGFILVAIMLSVSLSFCAWDTLSARNSLLNSGSGDYSDHVKLVDDKFLPNNVEGQNGLADVGDIVTFGKYYQAADTSEDSKTPIRWIIVEKEGTKLTLLAEKVMAFGNFWGNWYNDGTNTKYNDNWPPGWNWATYANGYHYQNYSQSTIRAWLNSNYTLRNDAGEPFSAGNPEPRFRGFMSEAFSSTEQNIIVPKTISGMKGYTKDNIGAHRNEEYASVTDKVWIPSWSEVYGTTDTSAYAHPHPYNWATPIDKNWNTYDGANARFSYFNGTQYDQANPILNGYTTAYASSQYSNYTVLGATSSPNMQGTTSADANVWWWLRSPMPSYYYGALVVTYGGSGTCASTTDSNGGVRPAVCVKI